MKKKGLYLILLGSLIGQRGFADESLSRLPLLEDARLGTYIAGGLGLYAPIEVWKADIERAKKLNMGVVRCNSDTWDLLEPQRGNFTWNRLDAVVQSLNDAHIDLLFTLPISSQWNGRRTSLNDSDTKISPTHFCTQDLSSVREFCKALATRYKGRITYYEAWNEPDFDPFWEGKADPKRYFGFIQSAYAGLKEGDPHCVVLMGGLAKPSDPSWFDQFLALGGGRYFDRANIHVYPAFGTLRGALTTVRGMLQKYGLHKPIWITETSSTGLYFDTSDRTQEEHKKAVYLVKTYAEAFSQPDVERLFWHSLRNPGSDVQAREMDFGLMSTEGVPTPAYQAYEYFCNELLHSRPLGKLMMGGLEVYPFDKTGHRIWVLWSTEETIHGAFPPGFSKGRLVTWMGKATDIAPGQFSKISITTEPVYLELYR